MKNTLMLSAAVIALVAGMSAASAQTDQPKQPSATLEMKNSVGVEQKGKQKAETKSNAQMKVSQDLKAKSDQKLNAQPAEKSGAEMSTSGQAGAKTEMKKDSSKSSVQSKSGTEATGAAKTGAAAQDEKSGSATSAQGKTATESSASTNATAAVNLSAEQKTKIRETVLKRSDAPRVSSVNFSLTIGTPVPRSFRHRPLPVEIIQIYPSWRGYEYFLVGDEIVIVNPRTLRIVAIIPA